MKMRCIKRYSDVKLKKIIEVDTIFDVDEERANHLVNEKVAEIVNETEKTAEKAKLQHYLSVPLSSWQSWEIRHS